MKYTILGASGFIGKNLCSFLEQRQIEYFAPDRNYTFKKDEDLGNIIYCIGLTADFRTKPIETVKAHVCKITEVLENAKFDSLLYLSSTRVYNSSDSGKEDSTLLVNPNDFSDLYNISKLMGESICLSQPNEKIRVARLSNVIGNDFNSDNFLFSLIKEAVKDKKITLRLPPDNAKDYIHIDDVLKLILLISEKGSKRVYNIASGIKTSNQEIIDELKKFIQFKLDIAERSKPLDFPGISIKQIETEFSFTPANILDKIEKLVENYLYITHDTN